MKNEHRSDGDTKESEARRICEQQIIDNAEIITANTEEEKNNLIRHYDASPDTIRVVHPGADNDLYTPGTGRATERARRELGLPLDAKVIAFVGRMQTFKGPHVLLKAVAKIVDEHPDFPLRVIMCGGPSGQNATPREYETLARELHISRIVRFAPPRPPEELVMVYRAADVVAVPSYNESFGLVALEAQAAGTPVIAADVGGLPTAVRDGETGLLVSGHDPHTWADALYRLLSDDSLRIAMGRAAVSHAATYSWKNTARTLASMYTSIAGTHPSPCDHRDASGEREADGG